MKKNTSPENKHDIHTTVDSSKPHHLTTRKKTFIAITVIIILFTLVIAGFGVYFIYLRYFKKTGESSIPSSSELREKAAKRYQELTGISYEEQSKVQDSFTNAYSRPQDTLGLVDSIPATIGRSDIDISVKNLSRKLNENKSEDVYYTSTQITFEQKPENIYSMPYLSDIGNNSKIDYSKTLDIETWTSPCNSKYVLKQDGNVLHFSNYTQDFFTSYLGGKYAVKALYSSSQEGVGCLFETSFTSRSLDLEFIQAVLSTPNSFKQIGTEKIDGVDSVIYETQIIGTPAIDSRAASPAIGTLPKPVILDSKTRYYTDAKEMKVLRSQYFQNEKLIATQNIKQSHNLGKDGQKEIQNNSELKNIDIKETEYDQKKIYSIDDSSLANALQLFPILYSNKENETVNYLDIYPDSSTNIYLKLTETTEFDPDWESKKPNYIQSYASYFGNSYSVLIFKSDPQVNDPKDLIKKNTEIIIDGKKVAAVSSTYKSTSTRVDGADSEKELIPEPLLARAYSTYFDFKYQNFFYRYGFLGIRSRELPAETDIINLISLTPRKAKELDTRKEFIKNSQPQIKYITNLNEIDESVRYFPGDLSKDYNLFLNIAIIDDAKGKKSSCLELQDTERPYSFEECLIDSFGGVSLNYNLRSPDSGAGDGPSSNFDLQGKETPPSKGILPTSLSTKFYVFDAKYTEIEPYLTKLFPSLGGLSYLEKDGKTLLFSSFSLSEEQRMALLNLASKDKDIEALERQLKGNGTISSPDR
jgi:hypothetical protein